MNSRELREELHKISVTGYDLRVFLMKVLDRMVELENIIERKANTTEDGAHVVYKYDKERV